MRSFVATVVDRRRRARAARGSGGRLVVRFALISAVAIVVIGVVIGQGVQQAAKNRGLADAQSETQVLLHLAIQPDLTPSSLRNGLTPTEASDLGHAVALQSVRTDIARLKIWNTNGEVVFSDRKALIGQRFPIDDDLGSALAGHASAGQADLSDEENDLDRGLGPLLSVYMPIRFAPTGPVDGALEIYVPYTPIVQTSAAETRMIDLRLFIGLLVLWVLLFQLVSRASVRLRSYARQANHNAAHDALTGLPNRTRFQGLLAEHVRPATTERTRLAVLLIDLDQFKDINDTLGHHVGDEVLRKVGERLVAELGEDAIVARLGGDEFGALVPDVSGDAGACAVARRIVAILDAPIEVQGTAVAVSASVGYALCPENASDPTTLLQQADVAMYAAKEHHEGPQAYRPELNHHTHERLTLMTDLRGAVDRGELVVYYQPKARLRDGAVTGVEALARWLHPTRGLITPDVFIPLAEQTGLIDVITDYVLDTAVAAAARWRGEGRHLTVAVNLSVRSLYDDAFVDRVARVLSRRQLPGHFLELEITEGTMLARPTMAADVLGRLAALGIHIAIDDFGTGYSSLGWLSRLPVSTIKIDKSFVMRMRRHASDASIVRSTIELGHALGILVVAEGVESADEWADLAHLGCDAAQGYFLARPAPDHVVSEWLSTWRAPELAASH